MVLELRSAPISRFPPQVRPVVFWPTTSFLTSCWPDSSLSLGHVPLCLCENCFRIVHDEPISCRLSENVENTCPTKSRLVSGADAPAPAAWQSGAPARAPAQHSVVSTMCELSSPRLVSGVDVPAPAAWQSGAPAHAPAQHSVVYTLCKLSAPTKV